MNDLIPVEQKLVNFNGAEIMTIKCNDRKIRVGVKWVCTGIGLSDGQYQNQTRKINDDIVLSKGIVKMQLPTAGGTQEVLCLELNFLIEGKHYFLLKGEALEEFKAKYLEDTNLKFASELMLWTQRGASRHCKILDTDKAWEQFDNLEEVG